ncbi:disease resistance protein Pik-2-like [Lolium rigidum]|uniref:disease resistance protein Pik-2-like n=1 Tax=Lolium rigidum TaxID=89674 RepID=UPI001F5CC11F|nr:disease resistance protein Pik-2-like [Lolium rigidum]
MEATAVSLARSVLDGVLSSAGNAVADEVARLLGVPREVEFIRNELEMMQSFLRVASARPDAAARNDTVRTWVKQVRDLAYDVEDCLFDFALYSTTAASSWSRWLPDSLAARHSIAQRIRDLKHSVEELNKRNLRYHVIADPRPGAADADVVQIQLPPYHDVLSATELAFQEWEIIGRSSEKEKLVKELMSGGDGSALAVVSVWGMGGMGKSSLVSMARTDPELLDAYDCSAWVTVPHPLDNTDEFMRRLRKQLGLGAAAHDEDDDDDDIKEHLKEKRYLIVVDDLLKRDEWDQVRPKLFNFQNAKGSRVIVTTRRKDVALYCAGEVHDHVYELKPLGDKESRNLLCKKVYKTTKCSLPVELEEETKCILERCRGLPLAISTIGGLLANRPKTSMEWMKLHEHFGAELESDLRNITNVIVSSYDGLPYHLKSIFLYLCIFPQNCDIRCNRLLRRWMAEGYIAKNRDMPVEEVAERFYNELMNRSMIQPSKKKKIIPSFGVGHSTIHSMLLQIILPKAIEENQLFLIEKQCNGVPQSKIRHLVVSRWNKEKKLENINLSYIRSLTVFGDCPVSLISPKMRLLRVLDLEDTTDVKNEDLRHIGNLHHLRYLSLRGKNISKLPSSLQNLRYLETLDIQGTKVTQLPPGIVELEKLRYILAGVKFSKDLLQKVEQAEMDNQKTTQMGNMAAFVCCNRSEISNKYQLSVKAPKGIEKLRNLHMLGALNIGRLHGVARRLEHLTDLQRLGVTVMGLSEKGSQELCHSIGKLGRLQRLEVRSHSLRFLAKMDESTTPKHLASLKLLGNLCLLPKWIASLNDLTKVRLLGTKLEQGQVDILGNLRSLAFLGLWEKSYIGESLCFYTSKFPKLKFLDIDGLQKIKMIEIKVHAMPELEQLWVQNCRALSDSVDALSGVPHLVNLNELLVMQCGEKEKLIETLQWQISQWQVSLHKKRPKFFIGKIILPASSQPSTAAGQ